MWGFILCKNLIIIIIMISNLIKIRGRSQLFFIGVSLLAFVSSSALNKEKKKPKMLQKF